MAKRKSPEARLAEVINELGDEKAESLFQFLKALNKPIVNKGEPKARKANLLANLPERNPEKEAKAS